MSQQAGHELSVYLRVARAAKGDQRKGVCYDRPYRQQATLQSHFFDFLACRRGTARRHGCRATTSDPTCCDAARRDQARAPWRAAARYQLDRSDLQQQVPHRIFTPMASWHSSFLVLSSRRSATEPSRRSMPAMPGGNLRVRSIGSRAMRARPSRRPCSQSTSRPRARRRTI
jgi:hypothetical protein